MTKKQKSLRSGLFGMALAGVLAAAPAMAEEKSAHAGHDHGSMSLHHMHLMINHAMSMATQGASMIMVGQMGMAKGVDSDSISHGKQMISNAKAMVDKTLGGEEMKAIHAEGGEASKGELMGITHKLGDAAKAYIAQLEAMAK